MRIVCAPDSFKGSLTAVEAAEAMADGAGRARPDVEIDVCPVGDGGEGTLESLLVARNGEEERVTVRDSAGNAVQGAIGLLDGLAWVESASAIGLGDIRPDQRNVMTASSYGVGELILSAAAGAPGRIVVGVGGSATNDGGCGMAQALGVRFMDSSGDAIARPIGGGDLRRIHAIDISEKKDIGTPVVAACDVTSPLTGPDGAAHVFAPQKGATRDQVEILDAGLAHLADVIYAETGTDVRDLPGAGAAGGLGAGLAAFADAQLVSGTAMVLEAVGFAGRVAGADLCLTGEGRLDGQSLAGKICIGVAWAAAHAGVPAIALVGSTGPGAERCLEAGLTRYVEIGKDRSVEESIRDARELLAEAASSVIEELEA